MTVNELLLNLADIIRTEPSWQGRLAAMKMFLDHSKSVLDIGQLTRKLERRGVVEMDGPDGRKYRIEHTEHQTSLIEGATTETERLLEQAFIGVQADGQKLSSGHAPSELPVIDADSRPVDDGDDPGPGPDPDGG